MSLVGTQNPGPAARRRPPVRALRLLLALAAALGAGTAAASAHTARRIGTAGALARTARHIGTAAALARTARHIGTIRPSPAAPQPLSTSGIYVQGPHLMQNGAPFIPRGVQIVGLVAPTPDLTGKYIPAHQHFGAAELAQAAADHANLVRFQVSEFGLNPSDQLYDPHYLDEVISAVELARAQGLNVIVSLQAQTPAGNELRCPLDDAGAATDWRELAQAFAGDDDVMFELYNEPGVSNSAANWAAWANGGVISNGAGGQCTAVGVQSLVDEIRALGADNVIILPGLNGEQTLAGVPKITDPADPSDPQLAYGIHYPNLTQTSDSWDAAFGNLAERVPVIVTEWQANGTTNCVPDAPRVAPLLLTYLALKQIGVVGFAFDLPGTIVADYNYNPTTYAGFSCGMFTGGVGQVLFDDFAGEAQAVGGTGASPPSWLLTAPTLARMQALDAGLVDQALDTPRTFVLGASAATLAASGLPAATPAEEFTSVGTLRRALATGAVFPGTEAVVLALGPRSPRGQQRHAAETFDLAATAAHHNGYLFIAAPQIGLVRTLEPHARRSWLNFDFIRRDLAGVAARYADAVVLPFGSTQKRTLGYTDLTRAAVMQANQARPGVQIIGGLSVGSHSTATAATLASAVQATGGYVTGYSLSGQSAAGASSSLGLLQQLYAAG
ncbi:MAG TPA: cellulase family glycosylhydrolase [Solirubrobacteraceae bacterium]|nr:cellulase family glycosylhydrolase [Solirubrobacteraceae bacterium]